MKPRRKKAALRRPPVESDEPSGAFAQAASPFPDVPTFAEPRYADVTSLAWFGRSGSPNLPPQGVQRMSARAAQTL